MKTKILTNKREYFFVPF